MSQTIRVKVVTTRRRDCYVLRWQEPGGRWRQRQARATRWPSACREASQLEQELATDCRSSMPLAALVDRFEAERCGGRANYNLRSMLARCQAEAGCQVLGELTPAVISRTQAAMQAEGRPATTIRGYLQHLRAALQWAHDMQLIEEVPLMRLPKARGGSKMRSRPITGEEFDRLLLAVPKVKRQPLPWLRLINVLYWGGLRIGEAARLTQAWGGGFQIDLDHRPPVFNISQQKNGQVQQVPVAPELVGYLRDQVVLPSSGRLLRGLPRRVDSLVKGVAAIGARAGIIVNAQGKTVTAHDLRRSFATRWARELKPVELCTLMRHRDISTTMDYYIHLDVRDLGERLAQVARNSECTKVAPPPNEV